MHLKLKPSLILIILLVITMQNAYSAIYYHLLSGGEAGYQFTSFHSAPINDMIKKYNETGQRASWDTPGGSKLGNQMEELNFFNGFYLKYNFYKYLDKSSTYLNSYQFSAGFEKNWAETKSEFNCGDDKKGYRNYDFSFYSLTFDYEYGFSPLKNLILSGEVGIGFDNFNITSSLTSNNFSKTEALKWERERILEDSNNDSLQVQDGDYSGNGLSIKIGTKTEYFFNNNLSSIISVAYKYSYVNKLKNDNNKEFRESEMLDSKTLELNANSFFIKFGFAYYFLLE